MDMVICRGVKKDYDGFYALKGLDMVVGPGDIVGLLGPNGAGKTTLMHIIAAILKPTAGSVKVMGYDVVKSPMEVKKVTGFLPENPPLYERLTGYEFLAFVGRLRDMAPTDIEERISFYSRLLRFDDKLDTFTGAYSKGLKQKVGIAAAMMHNPSVLILDEPASGLDPGVTSRLKSHLKRWVGQERAIIISTHLTGVAEALCNRIVLIDKGRVLAHGSTTDILNRYGASDLEEAFVNAIGDVDDVESGN